MIYDHERFRRGALGALLLIPIFCHSAFGEDRPGDCTERFFDRKNDAAVAAHARYLERLADQVIRQRDLLLNETAAALSSACSLVPGDGPFARQVDCDYAQHLVEHVRALQPRVQRSQWESLAPLWAEYLKSVAGQMRSAKGWDPCSASEQLNSFRFDTLALLSPVIVQKDLFGNAEERNWYPFSMFMSPFLTLGGAIGFATDSATALPNWIARRIHSARHQKAYTPSDTALRRFDDTVFQLEESLNGNR